MNAADAADVQVTFTDDRGDPLHWGVVELTPLDTAVPATAEDAELTQRDLLFAPFVLPVRVNSEITFKNEDKVRHHVYSFAGDKSFEIRLFSKDERPTLSFDTPGVVPIGCNIHDNMLAFIYVTEAPYYGASNEDGVVTISDLPSGRYSIGFWHVDQVEEVERLEIVVAEGSLTTLQQQMGLRSPRQIQENLRSGGYQRRD